MSEMEVWIPRRPSYVNFSTTEDELSRRIFTERSQETKWSIKLSGRRKKTHKIYASLTGEKKYSHHLEIQSVLRCYQVNLSI